jgi:hypothetical protein
MDPFSRDFERIRRVLGGRGSGPPRSPGGTGVPENGQRLPVTARELEALTGLEWRPAGVPAPTVLGHLWGSGGHLWQWTSRSAHDLRVIWENDLGFATRRDGWVVLYGALPRARARVVDPETNTALGYTVTLTHPELDEEAAEAAFFELRVPNIDRTLFRTDSQFFPFLINLRPSYGDPRGLTLREAIASRVRLHLEGADFLRPWRKGLWDRP